MRLLYGHDAEVAQWVGWRIPYVATRLQRNPTDPPFGPCKAIGVLNAGGELVAGVVYQNYDPDFRNIELSFASTTRNWLTRDIVRALLRYPFEQLGCMRVTGVTPRRATSARQFLDRFGFKREGCVRFGFGNDHAIISGLLRSEWQGHRLNRERAPSPSGGAPAI